MPNVGNKKPDARKPRLATDGLDLNQPIVTAVTFRCNSQWRERRQASLMDQSMVWRQRQEDIRELQNRPNSHLAAGDGVTKRPKQTCTIRTPKPSSVSSKQEQAYPSWHPLVEDIPQNLLTARVQIRVGLEFAEDRFFVTVA